MQLASIDVMLHCAWSADWTFQISLWKPEMRRSEWSGSCNGAVLSVFKYFKSSSRSSSEPWVWDGTGWGGRFSKFFFILGWEGGKDQPCEFRCSVSRDGKCDNVLQNLLCGRAGCFPLIQPAGGNYFEKPFPRQSFTWRRGLEGSLGEATKTLRPPFSLPFCFC